MMRPRRDLLLALLAAVLVVGCDPDDAASPVPASEPGPDPTPASAPMPEVVDGRSTRSNADAYVVTFATDPDPIPLNEPFALELVVRHADGRVAEDVELVVDGRMPHHRHGMNQVPTVEALGDGRFRVTDMLFHMSGRWELHVDVTSDGMTERAQFTVELQ